MYEWIRHYGFGGIVVAAKSDKISRNETAKVSASSERRWALSEDKVIPYPL
jgi:GTP-binding protein